MSRIIFIFIWALFFSTPALGMPAKLPAHQQIIDFITKDLKNHRNSSFEDLLKKWGNLYGSNAVQPLLSIALNQKWDDSDRFKALMSAAKLGGAGSAAITPITTSSLNILLKDRSWLIRSGALRCIRITKNKNLAPQALNLLKDKALVVRSEAIETTQALRPPGSVKALLLTLYQPSNYQGVKALWIPKKALKAIAHFHDKKAIPLIERLINRSHQDPDLKKTATETLLALRSGS